MHEQVAGETLAVWFVQSASPEGTVFNPLTGVNEYTYAFTSGAGSEASCRLSLPLYEATGLRWKYESAFCSKPRAAAADLALLRQCLCVCV